MAHSSKFILHTHTQTCNPPPLASPPGSNCMHVVMCVCARVCACEHVCACLIVILECACASVHLLADVSHSSSDLVLLQQSSCVYQTNHSKWCGPAYTCARTRTHLRMAALMEYYPIILLSICSLLPGKSEHICSCVWPRVCLWLLTRLNKKCDKVLVKRPSIENKKSKNNVKNF